MTEPKSAKMVVFSSNDDSSTIPVIWLNTANKNQGIKTKHNHKTPLTKMLTISIGLYLLYVIRPDLIVSMFHLL